MHNTDITAYFASAESCAHIMPKKLTTGVNLIKLSSLSLMLQKNKLTCLSLASLQARSNIYRKIEEPTLKVIHLCRVQPYLQMID
jgi:hypothetical protein